MPHTEPESSAEVPNYGCWGGAAGGCLIPMVLFAIALIGGDLGGPLFWPALCLVLAIVGGVVGTVVEGIADKRRQSKLHRSRNQ